MLSLILVASLSITGVADGLSIFQRLKNRGIYKRHWLEKQWVLKKGEMATYIKRLGRCSPVNHSIDIETSLIQIEPNRTETQLWTRRALCVLCYSSLSKCLVITFGSFRSVSWWHRILNMLKTWCLPWSGASRHFLRPSCYGKTPNSDMALK